MSGVYTIKNKINNKLYVGISKNVKRRLQYHKSLLKRNKHFNLLLQNSFNKYGIDCFEFELLEECNEIFLYSLENYWCNMLNTHNRQYGYNISPTHPNNKCLVSKETRNKQSKARSGKSMKESTKKLISLANKGKTYGRVYTKHSEKMKLKISLGNKGKIRTLEFKQKLRDINTGKKMSESTKNKMSLARKGKVSNFKGKKMSKESRLSLSKALTGKKATIETKIKLQKARSYLIPLVQLDKNNNIIKEWESALEVHLITGWSAQAINQVLKKKRKTYKNYKWMITEKGEELARQLGWSYELWKGKDRLEDDNTDTYYWYDSEGNFYTGEEFNNIKKEEL